MKNFKKFILFLLFFIFSFFQDVSFFSAIPDTHADSSFLLQVNAEDANHTPEDFSPNISHLHPQWNHNLMNIGEAWADGYTGEGIKIAVLDTGFYHRHPDISVSEGYSVFPDDPWSNDHSGHGTHIAGIISAKRDTAYQGIAPDADVYAIKIYNSEDINDDGEVSTDTESVRRGIEQAIEVESDIILISSGLDYHDEDLYQAIKKAYKQDIMIIAASGNGLSTVNYPARYEEVIAVTAIDEKLNPALDIIYGKQNEFSAPGVNIGGLSIPDSKYSYPYIFMSGSSQAVPHVGGLAAILMEKHGTRGDDIRKIMRQNAINIGKEGLFGHGLVYYVSDDKDVDDDHIDFEELEDHTPNFSEDESEVSEDAVVKAPSSREADTEGEEDGDLLRFIQITLKSTDIKGGGRIWDDDLNYIEPGGRVEILMRDLQTLYINEEQIAKIRENNIRLTLKKDHVSWTIPPANLVTGHATIRFYEGVPTGVPKNKDAGPSAYTTSLYQDRSRTKNYPSPMTIQFDFDEINYTDIDSLRGYYWSADKSEWRWITSNRDADENIFSIETKQTTPIGFFDPDEIQQEKINDLNTNPTKKKKVSLFTSASGKWILSVILIMIALFSFVFFSTKQA